MSTQPEVMEPSFIEKATTLTTQPELTQRSSIDKQSTLFELATALRTQDPLMQPTLFGSATGLNTQPALTEPNPAQGRGRGRGRPPGRSSSSRGRGRRGRSSNGSKGHGRGGAIVNDRSIGVAGTTPTAFESDGRRSEAAVSGGRGRGRSSGRFRKSPLPYRLTALQSQAEWEMKPLEEVCSIAQFGNQQEVIDFLLGD